MTKGRLRKAWAVWPDWADNTYYRDIVYAETAPKARYRAWSSWSDCYPDLSIIDVHVRRARHRDVILPHPHRLVAELTAKQRGMVSHAFGCDRHGNGYRDHYCTSPADRDMLHLAWELGLFDGPFGEKAYGDTGIWGGAFFYLTELGKEVAASMLPDYPA